MHPAMSGISAFRRSSATPLYKAEISAHVSTDNELGDGTDRDRESSEHLRARAFTINGERRLQLVRE